MMQKALASSPFTNDVVVPRGVNPGGWGRDPQILGRVVFGGRRGSCTGHKILLYRTMYRKYVRKW